MHKLVNQEEVALCNKILKKISTKKASYGALFYPLRIFKEFRS